MVGKGARSLVVGLYIGGEIDERAEKTPKPQKLKR
jgi:hypothetical protein